MSYKTANNSDALVAGLDEDLVLKVEGLSTHFAFKNRVAKAVRDVSFSLKKGETLAIVGESGSGKSVSSLSMMGLLAHPGKVASGSALYRRSNGQVVDLTNTPEKVMRNIRGGEIAMIFQEPMTSLNPLFTVGDQISEMLRLHESVSKIEARKRAKRMLELVEIPDAGRRLGDYPHHMSGGMRQRVMIAMSLICNPQLLIADEPTTALDVTIQAQILDLMRRLQKELNMSILFITHNMGVVAEIADHVAVMYAGEVVEQAPVRELFANPSHPYTQGLLASIPSPKRDFSENGDRKRLFSIEGIVPSLFDMPKGCTFAPRCQQSESLCSQRATLHELRKEHKTRCWKAGDLR
jgi:peptide/nickel transport system ATP-binding protein